MQGFDGRALAERTRQSIQALRWRKKIERIYNDSKEWEPPESWVYIAARCKQLVEVVASVKPYDDKKSITDYVDRVTAKGKMCEVLDAACESEISKLCKELTDFHVTIF